MNQILYEEPMSIEMKNSDLYVNGESHPKNVRHLSKMAEVFKNYVDIDVHGNQNMYYMFRSVYTINEMRYDITVIPAMTIEGECNKTYGHYHPEAEKNLSYPEVYQILDGEAIFILQKRNRDGSVDVSIIKAKKGDCIFLPPNYGHVSVNSGKETLVLANVVADKWDSEYGDYKKERGAAVYYMEEGNIAQNNNYMIKTMERTDAKKFNAKFGFDCDNLLVQFHDEPNKFEFLKKPGILMKK